MRPIVTAILALVVLASLATPASAASACDHVTAADFRPFSAKVWHTDRWKRVDGKPRPKTIAAFKRKKRCAAGPGHRKAMVNRWRKDRALYGRNRIRVQRCRSSYELVGRVSYFNGPASTTASGKSVHIPGLALNIAPGTDAGWNNSTTREWVHTGQLFRVTIAGHSAVMPVTDLGPSGFTHRAIDVTEAGVLAMGLSPSSFPTDSIGVAKLIPPGCPLRG